MLKCRTASIRTSSHTPPYVHWCCPSISCIVLQDTEYQEEQLQSSPSNIVVYIFLYILLALRTAGHHGQGEAATDWPSYIGPVHSSSRLHCRTARMTRTSCGRPRVHWCCTFTLHAAQQDSQDEVTSCSHPLVHWSCTFALRAALQDSEDQRAAAVLFSTTAAHSACMLHCRTWRTRRSSYTLPLICWSCSFHQQVALQQTYVEEENFSHSLVHWCSTFISCDLLQDSEDEKEQL